MVDPLKLPRDVPFSISCYDCDCDGPESLDAALAEGWTDIQYTPDGLAENFLGFCPICGPVNNSPPLGITDADQRRSSGP